jgi:5'-3' exonuclease
MVLKGIINMQTIILDGNNIAHICNYAMGNLSTDEQATGVIFGFMKQILSLSDKMKSNKFCICWDSRKSFRKNICPTYKANRHRDVTPEEEQVRSLLFNQISELRNSIIPELGFKNNFIKTGYEADDLIAYTVLMNPKEEFTIISTDQDLYQLLSDKVRIYNIITKKFFTRADFEEKFSLHPCMYREIKAIAGCTSDFVKGIKGVGEITAAKYLRQEPISMGLVNKIHEGSDIIEKNRKLTYLPFTNGRGSIPDFGIPIKKDTLKLSNFKKLFIQLSFNSFLKDMSGWERNFK